MSENILSYVVLEFFVWNPNWDKHLTNMMLERKRKYEEGKQKEES